MRSVSHILVMSSWYPTPEHPFLGNFVERQAHLLATTYQVTVLRFYPSDSKAGTIDETQDAGLKVVNVYHRETGTFIHRFISRTRAFKKALRIIQGVDLIHAHISFPDGLFFVQAKKQYGCPLILTEHASYFSEDRTWTKKMKWVIPRTIRSADRIIAVSDFLREDLLRRFPTTRVDVIGNHIDVQLFAPAPHSNRENFTFLHISTLAPVKRATAIVDAFVRVHKERPNCRLVIVSDESYAELKDHAEALAPGIPVSFHGPLAWEATVPLYQQADGFVLNSSYETFSIVLVEALACGVPLVSTRVGIADNLPETAGIFFGRNEGTDALENAMVRLVDSRSDYKAEIIRSHALPYDGAAILSQLKNLYEQS